MDEDIIKFTGGIPARSEKGERLLLFLGIIDILQQYKLKKKMEHAWKAAVHDGNSVSVTRPDFYKQRFLSFISDKIFPKLHAVPRPSSSSIPSRPATNGETAVPATGTVSGSDPVSPNGISITIDTRQPMSTPAAAYYHRSDSKSDQPPLPSTPKDDIPVANTVFGSPTESVLTHDLTTGEVASETPSVHPPAFSTPTMGQQQQQQQLPNSESRTSRPSSRSIVSEMTDDVFLSSTTPGASTNATLRVDNHIPADASSSLHADSDGVIGASVEGDVDAISSQFDSSASSDVLRRIRQLEDSSLNSFVGDIPSELKVTSSLLESVVDESIALQHHPQIISDHLVHQPGSLVELCSELRVTM